MKEERYSVLLAMRSTFGKRVQLAFWAMLFAFNLYLGGLALGWPDGLYRSILNVACHLINFYGFYSLIVPLYYEKKKYVLTGVASLALLSALTPFRLLIENEFVLNGNLALRFGYAGRLGFVIFTEITVGAFASLLRLASDNEKNKQRVLELSRQNIESELRFLKAQMNPHFLFNTINNIYSLTLLKSAKAPDALLKLSALLRYLLYESNEQVSLKKEFQALHDYTALFSLRFEQPVSVDLQLDVKHDVLIEPLVLIPILENALKHSGTGTSSAAFVEMKITGDAEALDIHCINSKVQRKTNEEPGGIGLANIKKRLAASYGNRHDLRIQENSETFSITLTIAKVHQ
jgi:sensor histidine kinase YesM